MTDTPLTEQNIEDWRAEFDRLTEPFVLPHMSYAWNDDELLEMYEGDTPAEAAHAFIDEEIA